MTPRGSMRAGSPPAWRPRALGRMPIRAKLVLILVVPLVAVLSFGGLRVWESTAEAASAEQVQQLVTLGNRASVFAHQLQMERAKAIAHLVSEQDATTAADYERQHAATDRAARDLLTQVAQVDTGERQRLADRVKRIREQIRALAGGRESIRTASRPPSGAAFLYSTLINDLLVISEQLAGVSNDRLLDNRVRASAALARVKEYAAQEHILLLEALTGDKRFEGAQYRKFVSTLTSQEAYLIQFDNTSTPAQRRLVDQAMDRPEVDQARALETQALTAGDRDELTTDSAAWTTAMMKRLEFLRSVENRFGADMLQRAVALREAATQRAIVNVTVVLLVLVLALIVSLLVTRSMVRPLARLRSSALAVAYESLPEVVRRLQDNDPVEPTDAQVRPVDIGSSDEIGQVAQAFNAVHQEAVRVAAEQAQLRQGVSAMFVNLARRSQLLVDRLIRLIDSLEQGERDPDRLGELFKVDHLATRMRRNDENLMVLAGADAGRRWTRPAPLIDVLRAATAEVEQYTRVQLGEVDGSVEVSAAAVNDLVHLIAELLENATSFSSPRTDVIVDARRAGDETIIEIEDQGIGMSRDQIAEFNERLAKPPIFDVTVSRMMGLYVVGRLASRHGIKVMLRSSASGGVLAIVTVPSAALEPSRPSTTSRGTQRTPAQRTARPPVDPPAEAPADAVADPDAVDRRARHVTAKMVPAMREPADELDPVADEPPHTEPADGIPAPRSGYAVDDATAPYRPVEAPTGEHRVVDDTGANGQERRRYGDRWQPSAEPPTPTVAPLPEALSEERADRLPSRPTGPLTGGRGGNGRAPAAEATPLEPPAPPLSADRPAPPLSPPAPPAYAPGPSDPLSSDPTIEIALPIFEAMESEWFRTRNTRRDTGPAEVRGAASGAGTDAAVTASVGAGPAVPGAPAPRRHTGDLPPTGTLGSPPEPPGGGGARPAAPPSDAPAAEQPATVWQSPADIGWEKARAAAEPTVTATTETGLPKRVPMAHFVPGHVEQPARPSARPGTHRSPEAVRGVLSSYRSGLEQGRQARRRSGTALAGSRDEQEEM